MAYPSPEDQTQKRVLNPPHLDNIWPNNQPAQNIYGAEQRGPVGDRIKQSNPGVSAVLSGIGDDVSGAISKGRYVSAAMKGLRGATALPVAFAHDHLSRVYQGLRNPAEDAFRAVAGLEDRKPDPVPGAAPTKPSLAYEPNPTDQRLVAGTQTSPLGGPTASAPTSNQLDPNQFGLNIYKHGHGQYSDRADGMGFGTFTGQPNAQNMAAADALAARSQAESVARLRGASMGGGPGSGPVEPGSFTGGYSGVIGSSDTYGNMRGRTPEQQRRDAEVSAGSIHAPTAAVGKAKLASLDAQQTSAVQADTERYKSDNSLRGSLYQADSSRASYAYTADQKLRGDTIGANAQMASSRNKLRYDMEKDQRDYNLNVEKYGVERASNALKQREASEKVMREQILGQLPLVKDRDGKMVPDEQGAAQYMRSAYARLDRRQNDLMKELQMNPQNREARAELESLQHYGLGALSADPQAKNEFLVGMQARGAAKDSAGWMPWSADRAAGASSMPITSLRWDPDSLLDGYRDQNNNWIPEHVIDQGGSWFGARTDKYDTLKRKD